MPLQKEKSNRNHIRKEEAERRAQEYTITISEHQRHLIISKIEVLKHHERTKPERELLDLMKIAKPDPDVKAMKKLGRGKKNGASKSPKKAAKKQGRASSRR